MKVSFSCDQCKSSFTVDAQLAGRTGRCRHCGARMVVPAISTSEPSAISGNGRNAAEPGARAVATESHQVIRVVTASSVQSQANQPAERASGWANAVTSEVGLKPITMDAAPALGRRVVQEPEESGTSYNVIIPRELRRQLEGEGQVSKLVRTGYRNARWGAWRAMWAGYRTGTKSYHHFFDILARLSRWISETSYTWSFGILILALVGGMSNRHLLTILGLSAIVILNLIGLAGEFATLVVVAFRHGLFQGLMLVIPPLTLIYLRKHWDECQKTLDRMKVPVVMLCLVVAAYMYVPWLSGNQQSRASLPQRIEGAVEAVTENVGESASMIKQKAEVVKEALPGQIDEAKAKAAEIGAQAKTKFDEWKEKEEATAPGKAVEGGDAAKPAPVRSP
jgi:hypothetical protein